MGYTADGVKIERRWLAHFIDDSFGGTAHYIRLGSDLESYAIELNPDVETKKNILGESSVALKGYAPQGSVDTYYAVTGSPLYEKLYAIIKNRATGSACETKVADVLVEYGDGGAITVVDCWTEDVVVVPQSFGGEDGVQIPFEIYYKGNRANPAKTNCSISNNVLTITTG
jgi:hypothetical protein